MSKAKATQPKTNLDRLLSFKEEEERKQQGNPDSSNWVKITPPNPGEGDKTFQFRVLPPREGEEYPFHKDRIHYFYVNGKMISGAIEGESSPAGELFFRVCRNAKRMSPNAESVKDALGSDVLYNTLRKLMPKERYYFNVVDRESDTVKILSVPKSAFEMILDTLVTHAEYGSDITDPEEGKDILLKVKEVKGPIPFQYKSVSTVPDNGPIGVEDWESQLFDLREAARTRTLTSEEIEDLIPDLLGDHYEPIMEIANND